jgi:predicted patatin/cPLA2 family phospholipase
VTHTSAPFWREDHPVLDALRERRDNGSTPADRAAHDDGRRIGLAVEGGGMRGVISGAMITALDDLGFRPAFDAVYGTSAGALNAAFFLLGDCWWPLTIYMDDLPNRRFMDFSRPLVGKPIVDLDYVFDEVLVARKPLDYDRVVRSDVPLCVAVTAVDRQATVLARDFADGEDLRAALRASSWLPGGIGGTTEYRGERALDGGVLTAHPHTLAAADGCTHILSLSTHPLFEPRRFRPVVLRTAVRYLDRIEPGLGGGYARSLEDNRRQLAHLRRSMTDPVPGPYVLDLGPLPGAPAVKRHETDRGAIVAGARYAYELMLSAIEGRPPPDPGAPPRVVPRMTPAPAQPARVARAAKKIGTSA